MQALTGLLARTGARLNWGNDYLPPLLLRLILAWEFFESGITKWHGENWFGQDWVSFPFPFNAVPTSLSWSLATYFELAGALALLLGLFTRFFAFSLIVLTAVATAAVHWPADWSGLGQLWSQGYDISDSAGGNFQLPLLFVVMLMPLVFGGAGRISLDYALCRLAGCSDAPGRISGLDSVALLLAIPGATLLFVLPTPGLLLLALAVVALVAARLGGDVAGDRPSPRN